MSMIINQELNYLRFDVPNSEANLNAQHYGCKPRTVGAYYMSENSEACREFLSQMQGRYFFDVNLCLKNAQEVISFLKKNNYVDAYRDRLIPQEKQIEALQWFISSGEYFYEISAPIINENAKYLKLDNNDSFVTGIKTLILGDLCSLYFKKIGTDGYILYLDRSPKFDEIIENNTILKWIQRKEEL